jgi:perosamine synthetase
MNEIKIKETIKFIRHIYSSGNNEFIPLHSPKFFGNEKKYLNDCIDSTYVSSVGKYVDLFEEKISSKINSKKSVAVVNGTAALQVALRLAGVKKGDEVITQALTFIATTNSIIYNDAEPIFLDVDLDTMGLSPKSVSNFLEEYAEIRDDGCYNKISGKKISACLPMHTFGFPVHIDKLISVCDKWKIPVVEDAAESLGSYHKDKHVGTFGKLGVFSFNGNKILTSGGGGVIVSNDSDLANEGKFLTTTAKDPHSYEYYHSKVGYNYRMPNINAALACAQLENLDLFLKSKRKIAKLYIDFFDSLNINFRKEIHNTKSNYWLMALELEDLKARNYFLKKTNANKIMTRPVWQLMFNLPMFKTYFKDSQKNAIYLSERIVNIPSSSILI